MSEAPGGTGRAAAVGFLGGALLASLLFGMLIAFFAYRAGVRTLVYGPPPPVMEPEDENVVALPAAVRDALIAEEAVIANAGNPTGAKAHDTFVVQTDPELVFRLRPDVRVEGHVLRAQDSVNIDPPLLYRNADREPTEIVRDYIAAQSRLRFDYGIDDAARRATLPTVTDGERVLMVGDSVMFGVGVSDADTPASTLQAALGGDVAVVNAGVGGYQAWQALAVAESLADQGPWRALVYFTSQNDFVLHRDEHEPARAPAIVEAFGALKDRFGGRVVLVVVPYLEVEAADFLLREGWPEDMVAESRALYEELPTLCRRHGVEYVDWREIADAWRRESGTVFAPFALFVDHTHLSPLGSRLAAERVAALLNGPARP